MMPLHYMRLGSVAHFPLPDWVCIGTPPSSSALPLPHQRGRTNLGGASSRALLVLASRIHQELKNSFDVH